jgi:hypothetical protein
LKGHDFSRAAIPPNNVRASAPDGSLRKRSSFAKKTRAMSLPIL